jgi:heptosyltransferase III
MPSKGKILVIRGGAIGDFILTLPAFAALRRHFPQAHIEVLGYPHIIELALAGNLVDRAQSIEARALAGFFARHGELSEQLTDYFSEFDLIVSYLYDPDFIFQTNIARCTPAQFIAGPHRPKDSDKVHAAQIFLKPLERLAIFDQDPVPRLRLSANHQPAGLYEIALHPGSGSERKNWPEQNWADLLEYLMGETNAHVLLVGGEAEGERLQRLAGALTPSRLRVAQSLPLRQLGVLLQSCGSFVGHDSGISHLAGALGLPGIILWSDTAEEVWRPPSSKMIVLRAPGGICGLSVKQVVAHLSRLLLPVKSGNLRVD